MQRVHFIAIGGAAMHNLAIAVSKKNNFLVTGSDDEIFEPSLSRLKSNGLLPEKIGWFPDRIHKGLSAIIIGMNAASDNPELHMAKELGLKIYSVPEYLYHQAKSKTRIVVAGSHGKTTITSMILFVLKQLRIDADFFVGAPVEGYDTLVKLSYEARIAVYEGDEYMTSALDDRPKFHLYKPHVAVITGISWGHDNVFASMSEYVDQFKQFTDLMDVQGRLIYFNGDENLNEFSKNLRRDIVAFEYNTPNYEIREGITYIKTKKSEIALKFFGQHNLQNLDAARLACRQIGVTDEQFYNSIQHFQGVHNRMQRIASNSEASVYIDYAHSPTNVKVAIDAMKMQFPERKLIACLDLNTCSCLNEDFLAQFSNCANDADQVFLYLNEATLITNNWDALNPEALRLAFGNPDLEVFTDIIEFKNKLKSFKYKDTNLLFMTKADFSGIALEEFSEALLGK